ncbi:aminotransferase class V-fold PLP-dependent enzyme [Streptomyces sp. NPDC057682]|uniref:aminotransferase class V-fold PLP-dependent enzyme n=1 Tax=Streptomyces sp. NPDC057682 TaxID=3346210 RepID=UPI00368CD554
MSSAAAPGRTPELLVLKIGGSLFSDKRAGGGTDPEAVADYARQVRDLAAAHPGRVVLVTGGGAACHEVGRTVDPARDPWSALALTAPAFAVRWEWTTRLRRLGVRAVPLQLTGLYGERPDGAEDAHPDAVRRLLEGRALPVLSSDCVLTADGTLRIVSSDEAPALLLDRDPGTVRIVALTDVPGVLTGADDSSPVLPRLDAADPSAADELLWPTGSWDATDAMRGKIRHLAAHARRGAQCVITRGERTGRLTHLFAPLESWPAGERHTEIATDRIPPSRTVLLNPGPVNVHPLVRAAIGSPDECHREPEAAALLASVARKATEVAGGGADTHATVLLTGSGTAALEAAVGSAVPPDGRLLVLDNGHYGERLHAIAATHRIPAKRLEFGWARPVDPAAVERALAADPGLTHVAMVHHETSTGMLNPVAAIGRITTRLGRSLLVDAISSLGVEALDVTADGVDWCVGTANKCLEGLPGISFVTAPRARFEALAGHPARTFYLDLDAHYRAQTGSGSTQFTPALQVLRALDAALDLTLDEGVEARYARYAARAAAVRTGLAERGIRLLLPPEQRAVSLTHAFLDDGLGYRELHDGLKERGYVIYATQGADARGFRIATMGRITDHDVRGLLTALDEVRKEHAAPHPAPSPRPRPGKENR